MQVFAKGHLSQKATQQAKKESEKVSHLKTTTKPTNLQTIKQVQLIGANKQVNMQATRKPKSKSTHIYKQSRE